MDQDEWSIYTLVMVYVLTRTIVVSGILTANTGPHTDPVPCQDTHSTGPIPASGVKYAMKAGQFVLFTLVHKNTACLRSTCRLVRGSRTRVFTSVQCFSASGPWSHLLPLGPHPLSLLLDAVEVLQTTIIRLDQ